ncbi:hypothetical protein [Halobacillus salinus]|nr:hypothetical protein [Halobacillus salinus]
MKLIHDLAGAIYDVGKILFRCISYVLAGMLLVAVPMYIIVWVAGMM